MEKTLPAEPPKPSKKEIFYSRLLTVRDALTPSWPAKNESRRKVLKEGLGLGAALMTSPLAPLADWSEQMKHSEDPLKNSEHEVTDLITDEELANTYHTKIWGLEGEEFVRLHFREGAKETKLFKRLKDKGQHLDILLIDDHKVDQMSFTPEQQSIFSGRKESILRSLEVSMQKVRDANAAEIRKNKEAKKAEFEEKIKELETKFTNNEITQDRRLVERDALFYTYSRYLNDPPTEDDLKVGKRVLGQTTNATEDENGKKFSHSYVFIAVRNMPETKTFTSGEETLTIPSIEATYSTRGYEPDAPSPSQSFIDPDEAYTVDMTLDEYVITEGRTPGDTLRHELQHATGVIVEKDADVRALQELQQASSSYKADPENDTGYWIVFETPEGQTITQNQRNLDTV